MEKLKSKIIVPNALLTNDVAVSTGNNGSNSTESFRQRYLFKTAGTPYLLPKGFDFNEVGHFYGKVDTHGRAILPKRESLVQVDEKFTDGDIIYLNKDLYALYLEFYEKMKVDFAINKIDLRLFTDVFTITEGSGFFGEVKQNYKSFVNDLTTAVFLENTPQVKDNAENFPLFLDSVFKLFELGKFNKYIFYSEYLLSRFNPMSNTGLVLEIQNDIGYDDNLGKFENYYRFPIYGRIICLLYTYGLRYDANAPWRFILDLNLKPFVDRLNGMTKQQYFEKNYDVVEGSLDEMVSFFEGIYLSYLQLLENEPLIIRNEQKISVCNSGRRQDKRTSSSYSFYRKPYTRAEFDRYIDKNFEKLLVQYGILLNSVYKRRSNTKNIILDIQNKIKKGLDKEDLVRYTFNKMKYC